MIQTAVSSSNLTHIGWRDELMFVRFKHGKTYVYQDVPLDVFNQVVDAPSVGKAFHQLVKDTYQFTGPMEADPFLTEGTEAT